MLPMASTARSLHVVCTIPGLTDNADTHLHKTGCHKCVSSYTLFLRIHSAVTIVGVTTGLGSPETYLQWFLTISRRPHCELVREPL